MNCSCVLHLNSHGTFLYRQILMLKFLAPKLVAQWYCCLAPQPSTRSWVRTPTMSYFFSIQKKKIAQHTPHQSLWLEAHKRVGPFVSPYMRITIYRTESQQLSRVRWQCGGMASSTESHRFDSHNLFLFAPFPF